MVLQPTICGLFPANKASKAPRLETERVGSKCSPRKEDLIGHFVARSCYFADQYYELQ